MNEKISELEKIAIEARKTFGDLSAEQLNWKSSPESWSVGQCFEHLIMTNNEMLAVVEKHVDGTHKKTLFERMPFLPKFFGGFILKSANPENSAKRKNPAVFSPSKSDVSANVIEKFAENQQKVISIMRSSEKLDASKTIITSPVAKFITYSLADAYEIVVEHEKRHFRQAERVMQAEGFPK
jgi:hypothetical protein